MTYQFNADYESVLFRGQKGSSSFNQALEFLYFFLETEPLLTQKIYHPDYLAYVKNLSGAEPRLVEAASSVSNWWGLLNNFDVERWWNSKITSTEFLLSKDWVSELQLLRSDADLHSLNSGKDYLLKDPFLMSGQKFQSSLNHVRWNHEKLLIAEPLLNRLNDFSTYVYPDGKMIVYENLVDERFQYKGTVFTDIHSPTLENLSFYSSVPKSSWEKFKAQRQEIVKFYSREDNLIGYSIDSFVYEEGSKKIYPLCEVNYRRTMGRIAYELGLKYGQGHEYIGFYLAKTGKEALWKKLNGQPGVVVFSPGDTRFEIFMIYAQTDEEAASLLANTKAAIDF